MCASGVPAQPTTLRDEEPAERIPLEPVDAVTITTVCDNSIDIFLPDAGPAHRLLRPGGEVPTIPAATMVGGRTADLPTAQHGFSVHVAVTRGGVTRRLLFDTGVTPGGCRDNLRRLGLRAADLEAIVCSHGHFDHTAGLAGLAAQLGPRNLPVVLHPDFWARRRLALPGGAMELPTTSRTALTDLGFDVVEGRRPSFLLDGAVLVTGEVDRTTGFETGFGIHQAYRGDRWLPDPLILDDQALLVNVAGKGLVVVTGCGHAGVVNIVRHARRLTGVDRIHAVLGGFHLSGPLFEPVIAPTVAALATIAPDVVVPAHCTGWRATHALATALPAAFVPSSVGTAYTFAAATVAASAGGRPADVTT